MKVPGSHENSLEYAATFALMEAMLSASSKLGIQGIFRKLVVSEAPENLWPQDIEMIDEEMGILVKARHLCHPNCPKTPRRCFTALKIEDIVCKRKSQSYEVSSVRPDGDDIEVRLHLFL